MKKMVFLALVYSAALPLLAEGPATWKSTSTTGLFNDGANWDTGVMPANGAVATVSGPGAYTISVPAEGLVDNSAVFMLAKGNPLSVTLDTTGTWWKKTAANYPQDWRAFGFSSSSDIGNHMFNMEGMSTASGYGVFFISNAVWRFQSNSQAATNVFESGLFDFAWKGETNRTSSTWMISGYGNPSTQRTIFKSGSHTIFDRLALRGSAPDQLTVFEGGFHEFYGLVSVKCDSPNAGVPNTHLLFTGSSSNLLYTSLWLSNASGNRGILRMEENTYARLNDVTMGVASSSRGLIIITNNAVAQSFGGDINVGSGVLAKGEISLGGNALYRSTGGGAIKLATGASSTGIVMVAETARMNFENSQGINIGQNTNIFAEMTVKDSGQVNFTGSGALNIGASAATGTLQLVDSALLNMPGTGDLSLGIAAGAVGVLNFKNTARLTRSGPSNLRIGTTTGGTGIVNVAENSSITVTNNSGNITLAGGNGAVGFLNLTDNAVVEMSGALGVCPNAYGYGEVNLGGNARMGLGTNGTVSIANTDNSTGVFNLNGNAVFYAGAVNKYFRHGMGNGTRAILNVNGGVFAATNTIFEPYAYYGEINLAGGESYVREYRFTGSGAVGTTNKLTVTGGRHVVGSSGIGMGNGNNRVDVTLVTVAGGELLSEFSGIGLGIGSANPAVSPIQTLTVSGGRFSTGVSTVRVATQNPSFGRVELTGGQLETVAVEGGIGAVNQGGTGYASFLSDGGKIIFSAAGSNRIEKLDDAKLGAGGLEIVNTSAARVSQAFTDVSGVDGRIVKNGSGVLTATLTSSHAFTQINAGELKLGTGVTQFGRNLAIASGASLNVSDNLSLSTLTASNSIIKIGAGKKITATTADLGTVQILTSGWDLGSYDLIEATNLTADQVTVSGEGMTQVYSVSVSDGKLTLTVETTPAPQTKTWQGSGSLWTTTENWNGGTPAKQDIALFNGADPKTVSVDSASPVTTIRFDSATGYTVSGAKLSVYSGIEAVSGSHAISAPVEVPFTTNVISLATQTGATLALSGALTENQSTVLTKTGGGTVKLSGANSLSGAISQEGGVLEFGSAESFGTANSGASALMFKAGTIRYAGAEATATKGLTISDSPTGPTNAFLFDIQNNLTLNGAVNNTKGAAIKIGTGNLTINLPTEGASYTWASSLGRAVFNANPQQMNGIPSTGYSGFTVVEGGVTFKGSSSMTVNTMYQTVVGAKVRGTNLTANATLTIDGCRANIGGSGNHFFVGYGIESGKPNKPQLNVINGAYVFVNALRTSGDAGAAVDTQINILNRGWIDSNWAIHFGMSGSSVGKTTVRMSNGVLRCSGTGELSTGGPLDFVAGSGSAVTQTCTGGVVFNNNASGQMRFEGGSRLYCSSMNFANNAGNNIAVQFDDGVLQPNAQNATSRTVRATGLGIELLSGGVTVDMSSVAKHLITLPIRGTGGLIKTGSGELILGDGRENGAMGSQLTAQYTGLTEVRAGRLSVETNGAGTAMRAKILAGATLNLSGQPIRIGTVEGAGTITNGTLTAVLNSTFTNGATQADSLPTFADVATSGLKVDFGRTDLNPVPVVGTKLAVAKVTGTVTPVVSAWRGQNMGNNIFAKFSIENGTVYAAFEYGGTRIILR